VLGDGGALGFADGGPTATSWPFCTDRMGQ